MNEGLAQLKNQLDGELHYDALHKSLYATDASVYRILPMAVAYPKTVQDIKVLISFATNQNTSLIPRTAGTSLAGQCVGEGIVVDVSRYFTKIISVDSVAKTVTVQPGVVRDELNTYLAPFNLFFGPNTSTSNRCMIGGMVGNNSSGTTSIQYGVTRDKVLRLKTLLSNGEEVTFANISEEVFKQKAALPTLEGEIYKMLYDKLSTESVQKEIRDQFPKPEIHRRNTGYAIDVLLDNVVFSTSDNDFNMCKLLCGSEGTLAFTTEITLQLDDLPPSEKAIVAAHYNSLEACLNDVNKVMEHQLYTCEMIDDVILDCTKDNKTYDPYRFFVEDNPKALLLLEVRAGNEKALNNKIDALKKTLNDSQNSYAAPILKDEAITMAMELRKAGLGLLGNMVGDSKAVACIEDTAVALPDLPAYIKEFTKIMAKFEQDAVYYAHAGAGELHLRPILNLKKEEGVQLFRNITTEVAQLVKKYRGSFSGEHGDGIVRAEFLEMQIGSKNFQLLREIKALFDPKNIFNPGKITDAWAMDKNLRTNYQATEIATLLNFEDSQGMLRLAEKCNGSGDCRKSEHAAGGMCPSYQATKNEKDTTRSRANMLREVLTQSEKANKFDSKALKEAFDLCIGCKACATECPSNVDMATAKIEFLYQYQKANGMSTPTKLFGKSTFYNKKAALFPGLSNWLFQNKTTSKWIKSWSGVSPHRSLPVIHTKGVRHVRDVLSERDPNMGIHAYLFVDEFSKYLDSELVSDAFFLLNSLGYEVKLIDTLDSARALLSKGLLKEARQEVNKNISALKGRITKKTPLIGLEPSAILGFRDEYLRLATDVEAATKISENTLLIEEFIAQEAALGTIVSDQFTLEAKKVKIHVHCHQKALSNQKVTFDMLNLPKNYKPTIIPSGCCGMAGSFGYEKEHYDISMQIGALKLFPSVKKASLDTIIAANGTSCRHQIKDGTNRTALHPVTILAQAIRK